MSFTSRWPDVYVAAGARAVSVCGDFLAATTLALVLQQAGHGGLAVSGLMVAAALPLAVSAPIAGRIADRVDSRTILVVAGIAQAVVCAVLAFTHQPVAIIGLVALLACGLAVTQPTLAALLPEMVDDDDLAKASGINQTAGVIGMMIAPALAGVLVGQVGARVPLLLDAVSYLSLVVAGFALRTRRQKHEKSDITDRAVATSGMAAEVGGVATPGRVAAGGPGAAAGRPGAAASGAVTAASEQVATANGPGATATGPGATATGPGVAATGPGVAATGPGVAAGAAPTPVGGPGVAARGFRLRDDRTLAVMVGAMAAVIAGVGLFNVVAVFLIRETLGASATMFGLVEASWTAGMLVGSVLFGRMPRDRITVRGLLLINAATCVPMLAGAAVGSAGWLVPLWLLGGIGNAGANVYVMVIIASRTSPSVRGRAFAVAGAAFQGAALVGLLAAGPLVEQFDPRVLVATSAVLGLLIALVCLAVVRPSTPVTPAAVAVRPERDSVEA